MQYRMTVKKTTMTDGMKEAIENRLNFLEKFLNEDSTIYVTVEVVSNIEQKIEVLVNYKGTVIKAEAFDSDLYVALDMVSDKVNKQISKQVDISKSVRKPRADFSSKGSLGSKTIDTDSLIAKRKQFDMKPMDELEAIEQMKLLDHQCFMFFNSEIQTMCLIYTKKDGKYGLIEGINSEHIQ